MSTQKLCLNNFLMNGMKLPTGFCQGRIDNCGILEERVPMVPGSWDAADLTVLAEKL